MKKGKEEQPSQEALSTLIFLLGIKREKDDQPSHKGRIRKSKLNVFIQDYYQERRGVRSAQHGTSNEVKV